MAISRRPNNLIAFQGQPGAYSELACRQVFPDMATLPTSAFEDTFEAVRDGKARYAMIPVENSVAGRVADIHRLMPESGLFVIGEHFLRVNHHLLAPPGATLKTVRRVHSHVHALGQCGKLLRQFEFEPVVHADTAGAAAEMVKIRYIDNMGPCGAPFPFPTHTGRTIKKRWSQKNILVSIFI